MGFGRKNKKSLSLSSEALVGSVKEESGRDKEAGVPEREEHGFHDIAKTCVCWSSALLVVGLECFIHATCKDARSLLRAEGDEECLEDSDQSYVLNYVSVVEGVCRCSTAVVLVEFVVQIATLLMELAGQDATAVVSSQLGDLLEGSTAGHCSRWGFCLVTIYVGIQSEATKPADWVGVYAHLFDLLCRVITTTAIFGFLYEALRSLADGIPVGLLKRCTLCRYDLASEGLESFDDNGAWVTSQGSQDRLEEDEQDLISVIVLKWLVFLVAAVLYYLNETRELPWVFQAGLTGLNSACWAAYAWALGHVIRWILQSASDDSSAQELSAATDTVPPFRMLSSPPSPVSMKRNWSKNSSFADLVHMARTESPAAAAPPIPEREGSFPVAHAKSQTLRPRDVLMSLMRDVANLTIDLGSLATSKKRQHEEEAREVAEDWSPVPGDEATLDVQITAVASSCAAEPSSDHLWGIEGEEGL